MADATIEISGTIVEVDLLGAQGLQGEPGPDTADAIALLAPLGTVTTADADVVSSQSSTINAQLADAAVSELVLGEGTYWIQQGIIVPDGKTLRGQGPGSTILKAMVDFEDSATNAIMVLLQGEGPSVRDMTIDANKRGNGEPSNKRCNGVVAEDGCVRYLKQNLVVQNCSGYGVYAGGSSALTNPPSGRNVNIWTFNCQVHFEPQGADGVIYDDCHARDGDADITSLQWFHPLVGSKNIKHYACTGYGSTGAGVDITANIADCENILFDGCDFEVTGTTIAFSVAAGFNDTLGLSLSNCRIVSQGGIGMVLYNASGSMVQTHISGVGVALEANTSDFICTGCTAYSWTNPAGGTASKGVYAPGTQQIRWNGGKIEAVGPVGLMIPYEGGVIVDAATVLIPASTGPSISATNNIQTDKGFIFKGTAGVGSITFKGGWLEYAAGRAYFGALDSETAPGTVTYQIPLIFGEKFEIWTTGSPSSVAPGLSATFSSTGLNLVTGTSYSVNGQQVVTGRLAALPADATDLATALTLLNAIKARLKTTGGHGLVAD
jgi:hypothetical protein